MYVIRPALRASTRPPARLIRGRRYPSTPRLRSLHTTRTLHAAKPPAGPDDTPSGDNDAGKPDPEKAAAEDATDAAVASEDPELLAQKLQRSREMTRRYSAALRRQQRSKKPQGLPPMHVPDWFLKTRVTRRQDSQHTHERHTRPACLSISVSETESGEKATCSLPASKDLDAVQALSQLFLGLWKHQLDDDEKLKIEQYLAERTASAELARKEHEAKVPQNTASEAGAVPAVTNTDTTSHANDASNLSALETKWKARLWQSLASTPTEADPGLSHRQAVFKRCSRELTRQIERPEALDVDPTWDAQQKLEAILKKKEARLETWLKKAAVPTDSWRTTNSNPIPPMVLAEIRASIAASLCALKPPVADSFPSAKTNLILHSSMPSQEEAVDACIYELAQELRSDLIVLTAQDLARLGGDYLGESSEPTPRSIRSLGYETYQLNSVVRGADVMDAAEQILERYELQEIPFSGRRLLSILYSGLKPSASATTNAGVFGESAPASSQNETQLEDMKLATLLDVLIDADEAKQSRDLSGTKDTVDLFTKSGQLEPQHVPGFFDCSVDPKSTGLELNSALPMVGAGQGITLTVSIGSSSTISQVPAPSKIIYVKDFKEMNATQYGSRLLQKLEELVRKRRILGESIMIVGSTCSRGLTPELSASAVRSLQGGGESSLFRTIVIDGETGASQSTMDAIINNSTQPRSSDPLTTGTAKFTAVNLSHICEMLKALDPALTTNITDPENGPRLLSTWIPIFPQSFSKRFLTYDEVHRIALTALGLHVTCPVTKTKSGIGQMSWAHVALAMGLLKASDTSKYAWFDKAGAELKSSDHAIKPFGGQIGSQPHDKKERDAKSLQRQRVIRQIASTANMWEAPLIPGIADPDQVKTTFDQVHVPPETIDSIRTVTSLALLRPDAFSYGILASEKITGALLYGPPGTGKTLLAKAVAKESDSTVLEVSAAQILGKYVGESEKTVAAIFSLAKKLSPCIVFLDEADSIFGSRNTAKDGGSHRATLNQFLKEWDGLNESSVFIMVATNRPFDLDDAVIRRLPRRLLVDLPTQADRKEILRIHLAGEQLDELVSLDDLAKRTPFYSGSDLKNIVVAAALACVKEENEQASLAAAKALEPELPMKTEADSTPNSSVSGAPTVESSATPTPPPSKVLHLVRGQAYNFPEKRTLHLRHFDKALQEISASISEDMSSLNAIKKFDEQYGDRKGKRKKKDFGFGVAAARNESAARVRV